MNAGALIRIPKGARLVRRQGGADHVTRAQRDRLLVAPYGDAHGTIDGDGGEEVMYAENARGRPTWVYAADVVVVDDRDHRLTVTRHKAGGHPIAGWNWPIWHYVYRCACGCTSLVDREDYALHLEAVAS